MLGVTYAYTVYGHILQQTEAAVSLSVAYIFRAKLSACFICASAWSFTILSCDAKASLTFSLIVPPYRSRSLRPVHPQHSSKLSAILSQTSATFFTFSFNEICLLLGLLLLVSFSYCWRCLPGASNADSIITWKWLGLGYYCQVLAIYLIYKKIYFIPVALKLHPFPVEL